MTDAQLFAFRAIAESMQSEPANWQWIGPHMSQRMFGITEQRARQYAERHGGVASEMKHAGIDERSDFYNRDLSLRACGTAKSAPA